jgi:sulfane dehydrogenase subunit SoxC
LASLQEPVLAISQTRFRFPWIWDGKPAVIQSRATDETGYSQPTHQQLIAERGPLETGSLFYHMNAIQSWGIAADGSVTNVHPLG